MRQSKTKLVADLQEKPQSLHRDRLIRKARSGHYHVDHSPLGSPKMQLIADLVKARFVDIAEKVRAGDYD